MKKVAEKRKSKREGELLTFIVVKAGNVGKLVSKKANQCRPIRRQALKN